MKTRRGFTVVEGLVVILVTAILVAILWPVFAKANKIARFVSKVNSAKSFGDLEQLIGRRYLAAPANKVTIQSTPEGHRRRFNHKGLKADVEIDTNADGYITYAGRWREPEELQKIVAGGTEEPGVKVVTVTNPSFGTFVVRSGAGGTTYLQIKPGPKKAEAELAAPVPSAKR